MKRSSGNTARLAPIVPIAIGIGTETVVDEEPVKPTPTFKIYPNPASDHFIVELNLNNESSGSAIIQLTTLSGNLLITQKTTMFKGRLRQNINLNHQWTDNIYIVKVIVEKKVFTARLVKINP